MSDLFKNHAFCSEVLKHKELPIYKTYEFDFFRCVNVSDWAYEKTVSELHKGNLRKNNNHDNRYSKLFPNNKISYWADSKETALAEIKKHGGNRDYLTFWSYDDVSSTFPTLGIDEPLIIIDGRDIGFAAILQKIEKSIPLTKKENDIIKQIELENPDCLAYNSHAHPKGTNFLFFEKGFNKLSLREVKLYLGESKSKNTNTICCAVSSDYSPIIKNYGYYFKPITKTDYDFNYELTDEYKHRNKNLELSYTVMRKLHDNQDNT